VAPFLSRHLPAGGFARAAAGLASASVLAQAVGLLAAPLLARLFTPGEIGALALFSAAAGLLAIVAGGRWHLAFAPAPPEDRAALLALTLLVSAAMAVALTAAAWPLGPWLAVQVGTARAVWAWLVPIGAALMAANLALRWLAVAEGQARRAGAALVLRPLVAATAQVAAGLAGADEAGLILGTLAGWLAADLLLLAGRRMEMRAARLAEAARTWRRYPAQALPAALAAHAVVVLPEFYLAARHGAHAVGLYSMMVRLLAAPVIALSEAVSALWWRRAAATVPGTALLRLYDRLMLALGLPALAGAALVALLAPAGFALLLGPAWAPAGEMARWLALFHALRLVSAPALQTGAALGRLAPVTAWNAADLALALLACALGVLLDLDLHAWLALYGGFGALSRAGAIMLMRAQAAGRI
jgi:O-antigen/teichoic acid export membrane protein